MYIRKIFYDRQDGGVLLGFAGSGDLRLTSFEEDAAFYTALAGRTQADTGVLLWTEPDAAIEAQFAQGMECTGVDLDTLTPIFTEPHTPEQDEQATYAELEGALNELGVSE